MSETLTAPVSREDIEAAHDLANEATSTSDVSTLREMLLDQNGGEVTITAEDGAEIDVKSIGQQRFAQLGQEAVQEAFRNLPANSESWQTEEK